MNEIILMKTTIILTILMLVATSVYSQQVNVEISVKLDGKYKQDTIYIGLYSRIQTQVNGTYPLPEAVDYEMIVRPIRTKRFDVPPGYYFVVIWAYGYQKASQLLFLSPESKYAKVEFILKPQIIGWGGDGDDMSVIHTVQLRGEFTQGSNNKPVDLIKEGEVWKLKKIPENLKPGMWYRFRVNGQNTDDLLNPRGVPFDRYQAFKMIYTGNEIVFDPSVYNRTRENNEIKISGELPGHEKFLRFASKMNALNEEWDSKGRAALSNKEKLSSLIDSTIVKLQKLSIEFPEFSPMVIESQLAILALKPSTFEIPNVDNSDANHDEKMVEFMLKSPFSDFFSDELLLIQQIDYDFYFSNGTFAKSAIMMQTLIEMCPELAEKFKLETNYFNQLLDDFLNNTPYEKLACSILFERAKSISKSDEAGTLKFINELQTNYDYNKYIKEKELDKLLAPYKTKLGRIAPDFSAILLNNNTFTLSDWKGKFILLDFWGTWCAPCRAEIPHLKNLYNSVSRDKLEIIGLAQDTENRLRHYISENDIGYPNSLASESLLAKYGISRFPTSFLINPEGMIVRKDMRGEELIKLIKYEIENYYK